ncbi:MAG: SDR family oxidoreductase [Lachnospiraceae bacterium]|nr:SDR family oxidoreductase [Lachnospiraceae bacterium]
MSIKSTIRYFVKSKYKHLIYSEELKHSYEGLSVTGGMLKNKVVVIVGATGDIGKAITKRFLLEGCKIIILARSEDKAKSLMKKANEQFPDGVIAYHIVDFEDADSIKTVSEKLSEYEFDYYINCVGIFNSYDRNRIFRSISEEQFTKSWIINYENLMLMTEIVAKQMRERFNENQRIINIGSICATERPYQSTPYGMSKSAVHHMTRYLNNKYSELSILCIEPGSVATVMGDRKIGSDIANANNLLGRVSLPEEIAAVSAFLCSDVGRFIDPIISASACETF